MSAEVVGSLQVIRFMDGSEQVYTPPRNTLDIRYAACRDHHPACDCREAHLAEDIGELLAERRELLAAFAAELTSHATFPAWTHEPDADFNVCSCTGCRIAQRLRWVRTTFDTEKDRRACRPAPPREEVPF